MSIDASGTYGKTLVFGKWKGRNTVRQRVIPANPKSAKQTGVRAMMSFLAQRWVSITALSQATWDALAESKQISAFNAYASEVLSRWQNFNGPSDAYPAAEASTPLTVTTQTLTGGEASVSVSVTPSGATAIAGVLIFRSTAEITAPNWDNCIAVIETNDANPVVFLDTPLEAGTYHYRTAAFNDDGIIGTVRADGTAVAT